MELNEYQQTVAQAANTFTIRGQHAAAAIILLDDAASKVVHHMKAVLLGDSLLDDEAMARELGTVMEQCAALATSCGLDLAAIVDRNAERLTAALRKTRDVNPN